jgi:hypothetical protein
MYWETLPNWFWGIYYLFFLITLGVAIHSISKNKLISISIITICVSISVPIVCLINSIGRAYGLNEFEHFITQIKQGSIWSIFVTIGFIYLLIWWVVILIELKRIDGEI